MNFRWTRGSRAAQSSGPAAGFSWDFWELVRINCGLCGNLYGGPRDKKQLLMFSSTVDY